MARQEDFQHYVGMVGERYLIDPRLILCIITIQSGFQSDHIGPNGEVGLGGIMPGEIVDGRPPVNVLLNPYLNIIYIAQLLDYYRQRFGGNMEAALAAYKVGAAKVERGGTDAGRGFLIKLEEEWRRRYDDPPCWIVDSKWSRAVRMINMQEEQDGRRSGNQEAWQEAHPFSEGRASPFPRRPPGGENTGGEDTGGAEG